MKIHDRVYMVGSGKYGAMLSHSMDCNVYLLDGGNGEFALIDAGGGVEPERIVANIERAGVASHQLKYLLLTHVHGDHAAGARFFHDRYSLEVIASAEGSPWLERADHEKTSMRAAIEAGVYPPDFQYPPCPVARSVKESDEIRIGDVGLKVIETPGHSRGHIGFLLEEGGTTSLFGGDAVFAGGKIVIQYVWDCSIPDYAETIAKLHRLHIERLYAGHGMFLLSEAWKHVERAHQIFRRLDIPPNL